MSSSTASSERAPLLGHNEAAPTDSSRNGSDDLSKELPKWRMYLALSFLYLGALLCAVDVTMTSAIAAVIASDFSSLAIVSWLGSAYVVATAAIQPLSGKLTDRFGRRPGYFLALFAFGLGNIMCALAHNSATMVAGRVVAGLGGGAMGSIFTFIISDLVPLRKRALWQGFGNVLWAAGMGIGGLVGGVFNDWIGWRWAFLGLAPFTLLVFIGASLTLDENVLSHRRKKTAMQFDKLGAISLAATIVCLVIGLNLMEGDRTQTIPIVFLVTALILFAGFLFNVLYLTKDPIIPIQLLTNRSVASVCISAFFSTASLHTLLFYVPLLIQVRGYSTSEVGLQLLGESFGASWGSLLTGIVLHAVGGYVLMKPVTLITYAIVPLAFFLSNIDSPSWTTVISLITMGASFGGVLTVLITGLLACTDQAIQAPVTSMFYAFRQVGASTGIAVAGILFRVFVERELGPGSSTDPMENIGKKCHRRNSQDGKRSEVCLAYAHSLHWVFLFALVTAVVALIAGMFLRNASLDERERIPNKAGPTDPDLVSNLPDTVDADDACDTNVRRRSE